jgi:hypothetical protein
MNNIVQRITSDSQEVKQTTDVLQQAKATRQQRHPNTVANLKTPTKEEPNLRHMLARQALHRIFVSTIFVFNMAVISWTRTV